MARTLLQIVNAAQQELGLPIASSVIGNTDATTQQMLGYANATLDDMRFRNEEGWTELTFEYNLVVSPPVELTGNVTEGSAVITGLSDTSSLSADLFYASGSYIPQGARIASVDSATQVTLTMEATGSETGATLKFSKDTYPLPSDFDYYLSDTWWDRTNRWKLLGPDSPQKDQWHRSGIVAFGPRRHWRQIRAGSTAMYRLWPPPAELVSPIQLVFEYITKNAVNTEGNGNAFTQYFENDTDVPLLNDRAIIMGIKWMFWEQKGFNWVVKRAQYDEYVKQLIGKDGGNRKLYLAHAGPADILISPAQVQDGFYPGPDDV